jgi:hypothetical protein
MKIRFLTLRAVLSVSVILVGGLASINPSSVPQSGTGGDVRSQEVIVPPSAGKSSVADGVPLPPWPPRVKPSENPVADGVPLPPWPPRTQSNENPVADGVPLPPWPPRVIATPVV